MEAVLDPTEIHSDLYSLDKLQLDSKNRQELCHTADNLETSSSKVGLSEMDHGRNQ